MTTEVPIVTTHGVRRYTPVSLLVVNNSQVFQPTHPEARTVVMNLPAMMTASTAGVCRVALEDIDNMLISEYELARDAAGNYKHIRYLDESQVYDSHYQNVEQRRSVCLGRFLHAATASLAHAIARSNEADSRFRCVPYSVQMYIESIIRVRDQPLVEAASQQPAEVADVPLQDNEDFELSLDDLVKMM